MLPGALPTQGVVMYETRVDHLIKERYASHEEAWRLIRTGLPRGVLEEVGLTKLASGWLLAWSGKPIRWLDDRGPMASVSARTGGEITQAASSDVREAFGSRGRRHAGASCVIWLW